MVIAGGPENRRVVPCLGWPGVVGIAAVGAAGTAVIGLPRGTSWVGCGLGSGVGVLRVAATFSCASLAVLVAAAAAATVASMLSVGPVGSSALASTVTSISDVGITAGAAVQANAISTTTASDMEDR